MRAGNTGVKGAVFLDVQLLLYMVEVLSELVSSGIPTGPSPVLHKYVRSEIREDIDMQDVPSRFPEESIHTRESGSRPWRQDSSLGQLATARRRRVQ